VNPEVVKAIAETVKKVAEGAKKVDWNKVADITKKAAGAGVGVITVITNVKKLRSKPSSTKHKERELRRIEKLLKKGRITKDEYKEMRDQIIRGS